MARKNVADLLVDVLAEAGVRQVYGVCGDSLNGITNSIRTNKHIQWVHVRHEETAAFAAGAEAHLTGKLAVSPSDEEIATLAKLLNKSKKITIFAGAGCAGAHEELIELAGKLNAPIVHAMRGKEYIEYDNPFDVGMTGLLGFSSGYHAMMNCDLLLMIGTDFPYQQFFPKEATIVQIDARGEQLGRRTKVDYGFVGDTKTTLRALRPKLNQSDNDKHLKASLAHYKNARKGLDELATEGSGKKPIHPQYVVRVLDELAAKDAIFSCDVGTPTIWAARYLTMNGKRRLLGSFNHGSMANALPQAIGAQVSHPGRQVVSLSGDGGLAMLMGDLLSLQQLQAPVKVIVFKNNSLAFVELEMKAAGILDFGTDLRNPNFAKMAEGAGLLGLSAETPAQVRPMIAQALKYDGPALVEVLVSRQELSMPPTITAEQAKGFSLFALKAVLSGRGEEILDLAKINLFR
jgi:pyruvate dehydrogenase (quinone)